MKEIIIFGAGGLAREVAFVIKDINRISPTWKILGFVETNRERVGTKIGDYSIFCKADDLSEMNVSAAIGIGDPPAIKEIFENFGNLQNISFPNIIHPGTIWDRDRISLGKGNIICAGNIFTTDIQIGNFNYFNLNCTYGHDIEIGDFCVFNPGINLSGGVKIGDGCLIGTGATILQYLNIGEGAVIGAGAVVTKDVAPKSVVVGAPAKPIDQK